MARENPAVDFQLSDPATHKTLVCGAAQITLFQQISDRADAIYHLLDLLPHTRAKTDTQQRMYSVMHGSTPN